MLLSPMFLVRIFDIHAYGQYREFMLYATLIGGLIEFSVNTNLIYFIPKYPLRERQSVTHTVLFILMASSVGLLLVYAFKGVIIARTSYNFLGLLIPFLFFFLNFDFFENYWLGKKRTDYVLIFSSARITVRTAALLISAFISRDVEVVIKTLIAVEAAKCVFVSWMLRGVFTKHLDRDVIKEQLRYILPLGSAVAINVVNGQLANLFISIKMGVERLALYGIGSQQIPVINIVRSSAMDVLFPEMAQIGDAERLRLWQRANVAFCFLVFPTYVVFCFYAPAFIDTLFTKGYAAAVPLFRIYLTVMVIQSFDIGTLLRAINQNKYAIYGNVLYLLANLGLIFVLFRPLGFLAPALAFVLGQMVVILYLGMKAIHFYRIRPRELIAWKRVGVVFCCAVAATPPLIVSTWIPMNPVVKAVSFSVVYLIVYYVAVRRFRLEEVELLVEKVRKRLRRS
jgi:O-antigen/teichoic acid export membrane protein